MKTSYQYNSQTKLNKKASKVILNISIRICWFNINILTLGIANIESGISFKHE